jgi:hypothetical protein
LSEAGLADPGLAENGYEVGAPLAPGTIESLPKLGEVLMAAHKRCLEVALQGRGAMNEVEEAPGDGSPSALRFRPLEGKDPDRVAEEAARGRADQDVTGASFLLELCCRVDRVARDERPGVRVPGQHLARFDSAGRGGVQAAEGLAQLDCGPHRAERVILVGGGNAEEAQRAIVEQPFHRGPVPLQHGGDRREEMVGQPAAKLRIETTGLGRADNAADEHGYGLAGPWRDEALALPGRNL